MEAWGLKEGLLRTPGLTHEQGWVWKGEKALGWVSHLGPRESAGGGWKVQEAVRATHSRHLPLRATRVVRSDLSPVELAGFIRGTNCRKARLKAGSPAARQVRMAAIRESMAVTT